MKRTKKLSILISIVLISIIAISAVSATDTDQTLTSDDNNEQVITDDGDTEDISSPTTNTKTTVTDEKTFKDLHNDIGDDSKTNIKLENDYKYNEEIDKINETNLGTTENPYYGLNNTNRFESGILIKKNCTIDGQGHYIDGANTARIFRIDSYSTVTLKNIIFKNAKATIGGAIYSSGKLTIENCTFLNNIATDGGAIYAEGEKPVMYYIDNKDTYTQALNDPTSALNKYYYNSPREDGIAKDGSIEHNPANFIAGHSFDSAIAWDETNYPFLLMDIGEYIGNVSLKYEGNTIYNKYHECTGTYDYLLISIPKCGLEEYRLAPYTGTATKWLDTSKLTIILINPDTGEETVIPTNTLTPEATLNLANVTFSSNKATNQGGAIYLKPLDGNIDNVKFLTDSDTVYPSAIKTIIELQEQITNLTSKLNTTEIELNNTKDKLNTTEIELNNTKDKLNTTEAQLKQANDNLTKEKQQNADLSAALANKNTEAANLQAQVTQLKQDVQSANNNANAKIKKVKAVKKQKKTKKFKITVTLSQAVKGKKVFVVFNNKRYTKKTNAKGVATFTIKKSALKKLGGKKVKYQVIYDQSAKTMTVKIKK